MGTEFMRAPFVADAIVAALKSGSYPSDAEARVLDRRPLIDLLRQRIGNADVRDLLTIVEDGSDGVAGFAVSLLRHHVKQKSVRTCFEARWSKARPHLKNRLMWRLLDDPNLDKAWHERFFDFVQKEWPTFRDFNRDFYGEPGKALASLLNRLADPTFPESKRWIYLCSAPEVVDDRDAAKAIVSLGLSAKDPFQRQVAQKLLKRFFPKKDEGTSPPAPAAKLARDVPLGFLAAAIVRHLRSGNKPSKQEADYLNRLPIIDALRAQITKEDLPWLFGVVEGKPGEVAAFYLSLVRRFTGEKAVQRRLRSLWKRPNAFMRAHLMWRLLDDPHLPKAWHERLFKFVLAEWKTFQAVSLKFLGTPETVVTQALKRIGDSSFPETKKWAYLCRVPQVAQDQEAAKALVTLGRSMPDPFARKVAGVLLQRFF